MIHSKLQLPGAARLISAACVLFLPFGAAAQQVVDFSDLSLPPASVYRGADGAGGFTSGGLFFNNHYSDDGFEYWAAWSYSNVNDTETRGWENQHAAIAGSGIGASGIYGVAYVETFTPAIPRIELPAGQPPLGLQVTNTTYAYYSMLEGDDFAKKFGGESGDDPDFFRLTVSGLDVNEQALGSVEFFLADYRFEDNTLNYIVDAWTWVDLSSLPGETRFLEFTLDSSDMDIFGMATPAYFAVGEVTVVPEPATFALFGGLVAAALIVVRRTARRRCG